MTRTRCFALAFALLASCGGARGGGSGGPSPTGCTAGTTEACTCASGATSTQTCRDDGTFGACDCAGEDATVEPDATGLPDLTVSDLGVPETPGLTCTAPRLNCDNNASNGCETDTNTSALHCGRCNNPCSSGTGCSGGRCACASGTTSCGGSCVNTQTDTANCGACGTRCNAGDTCSAGRCNPPAGMCPSSCRAESDCAPCRTAGDPGNYCCISGLCLYMTGACMTAPPDVPGTGGDVGGDGSAD